MSTIHIANTDFEFELEKEESLSIEQAWTRYPICLQLQFIPLLYADPNDAIAVTAVPDKAFIQHLLELNWWTEKDLPRFIPLASSDLSAYTNCLSWGFSKRVQQWAAFRQLPYSMPDWKMVGEVNSKAFLVEQGYSSPSAVLLRNERDLDEWLHASRGRRVIKTCFGLSGKGNFIIDDQTSLNQIKTVCQKEWNQRRPVVAEPWLNRFFDFSTQWTISLETGVELVGATVFETDQKGAYCATQAGPTELLFQNRQSFLIEHQAFVKSFLEKIREKGFYGSAGIDAFLYYDDQNQARLYPLVEINGRQTMSLAALRFQQRWFPDRIVRLSFASSGQQSLSFLPTQIKIGEKQLFFNRSLNLSIIDSSA